MEILKNIEEHSGVTQRDIARRTGISLGNVNVLIKRLVVKGLLKVEKLNSRTIRYILTPEGFKEKAKATYKYVIDSYKMIDSISIKIDTLLTNGTFENGNRVVLFSSKDEVCHMLEQKFKGKGITFQVVTDLIELVCIKQSGDSGVVIAWHPEYLRLLSDSEIQYINLLDRL